MGLFLHAPKITGLYAGILGIFYLGLSLYVVSQRWAQKTGLGHGSDTDSPLFRAVRIHSNFIEYVPFILVMMALDEMTRRGDTFLHCIGISVILGRVGHFIGLRTSSGLSVGRTGGITLTFIALAVLSVALIMKGVK